MNMHPAQFGATMQGGKHLARIEQQFGIERAFQALLLLEIGLGEHHGHQIALFDADSMFAGKDAADLDAQLQYIAAERLCAVELSGDVGVIEDQRVKRSEEHMSELQTLMAHLVCRLVLAKNNDERHS